MSVAATQRSAAPVAGPASVCDAVEPVLVEPGRGQRLGEPPRLGDAELLEAVEQLVLGVGGVERVERVARRGARRAPRCWSATSFAASLALDAGLDEARRSSS